MSQAIGKINPAQNQVILPEIPVYQKLMALHQHLDNIRKEVPEAYPDELRNSIIHELNEGSKLNQRMQQLPQNVQMMMNNLQGLMAPYFQQPVNPSHPAPGQQPAQAQSIPGVPPVNMGNPYYKPYGTP